MKEITLKDILSYHDHFSSTDEEIQKKIRKDGIFKGCVDQSYINGLSTDFNVVLPPCKIYDQKTMQSNIYSFLRVIKDNVAQNASVDINGISLSATYLEFFDMLEKVNYVYEQFVTRDKLTYDLISMYVERYIGMYGTFHYASFLTQKYGLVPTSAMPEVKNNFDGSSFLELLRKKVKADALQLMEAKNHGKDARKLKDVLMQEAYTFLAKTLGQPPLTFSYQGKNYTPLSFKETFLTLDLNGFVTVSLNDIQDFKHSYSYIAPVYVNQEEKIVHMEKDLVKKAIVHQLKQGMAVWFSLETSEALDMELGILSDKTHQFASMLHIPNLSSEELLRLNLIGYDQAMAIVGAKVENKGEVTRFLVDNSMGNKGSFGGRMVMLDSFFERYVITVLLYNPFFRQ